MKNSFKLLAASLGLAALQMGCGGGDSGQNCERCDFVPDAGLGGPTACDDIMIDHSGANQANVLRTLNDPFVNHVYKQGDTCPTTFDDIMAKLAETDTAGCSGTGGVRTRIVSETAQPRGEAQTAGSDGSYRAVVSRACDGRQEFELTISVFGLQVGAPIPQVVEVMAWDPAQGVFNYYKTEGNRMAFFGNSIDMLEGPAGHTRECAACHTGGGLVMKELNDPWLHWEDHMNTPGAAELVSAHAELFGSKAGGINMEQLTRAGNRAWNETRVQHLRDHGSVAAMLEPLFCSVEVNLDNAAGFPSPVEGGPGGDEVREIQLDALIDPTLKSFGRIPIEFEDYDAAIKAMGQQLPGVAGAIDTIFSFPYIERAEADMDYVRRLVNAGLIDQDFVEDVLMVDFTRPIFSDDRCDLLAHAPELAPGDRTADAIRDGFVASLEAASPSPGSPEAELLANLTTESAHGEKVDAFIESCTLLSTEVRETFEGVEVSGFLANLMPVISLNRDTARALPVFEFPATMPVDDLSVPPGARLHPTTCELTTAFVSVAQ
jgi:hypothetical protein